MRVFGHNLVTEQIGYSDFNDVPPRFGAGYVQPCKTGGEGRIGGIFNGVEQFIVRFGVACQLAEPGEHTPDDIGLLFPERHPDIGLESGIAILCQTQIIQFIIDVDQLIAGKNSGRGWNDLMTISDK